MINRLQATRYLVQQLTNEPIIASLGNPKFDLFTAQDRPQNFYMWNSMGMASSMGLGLAIARPDVKVIVLDGDGALLMNLNSLPTAAARAPINLIHVIWDNRQTMHRVRRYDESQPRDMRRTTVAGDGPTVIQQAAA